MKKNIVLIGFMGVGKGRTARSLAEKTGMFAVDCDDLIESFSNRKIKNIFAESGEQVFRDLERKVAEWLSKSVKATIISSGGGFYKVPKLNKIGHVVYLHGEFDNIIQGILSHPNAKKKIKKRPLLQDLEQAKKLYKERLSVYRKVADLEVNVDNKDIEEICQEIVEGLEKG